MSVPQSHHTHTPSQASTSVGEDSIMEDAKMIFHEVENTSYYSSDAWDDIDTIISRLTPSSTQETHYRSPKCIKDA